MDAATAAMPVPSAADDEGRRDHSAGDLCQRQDPDVGIADRAAARRPRPPGRRTRQPRDRSIDAAPAPAVRVGPLTP